MRLEYDFNLFDLKHAQEYAKKKKKEEEKKTGAASKPQSSSVKNVNKTASKSTFLGGGSAVENVKKATQNNGPSEEKKKEIANRAIRTSQKSTFMGGTQTTPTRRTSTNTTTNKNLTANTTAAQRQKMGMPTSEDLSNARQSRRELRTKVQSAVKDATSAENKAFMQRQKSGTLTNADKEVVEQRKQRRTEVAKNTGRAGVKGAQDAWTGYRKTMADLAEMTQSTDRASYGQAAKLGIDKDKDIVEWAKLEGRRQKGYKQAKEQRLALQEKQDARQAAWDERTKDATKFEKALYGAAESGTGMLVDMGVGAVTGTGQFGALASMGMRSYGTARGQAEKEGATENEDRLYSLAQAGKEVATELMFQGAGLAKNVYTKGKVGLSLADRAANTLTKGLTGVSADIVGAGTRLLGGTAEENIEEAAGWIVDPLIKELTYGKNVRERYAQSLRESIPEISNKAEAEKVAAYFSTSEFTDNLTEQYVKDGLSKKEAEELASELRDYYVAYYSGDQEKLEELEDDLARKLSGQPGLSRKSWSKEELLDTFAATTLLTMATGLPGAVTTSVKGSQAFDDPNSLLQQKFGKNAINIIADEVKNISDPQMSLKAETMKKRLDEGKDLTGTQKWDLLQGYQQKLNDTAKKAKASYGTVDKAMQEQDLVATMDVDRQGNRVYAKETQKRFNQKYAETSLTTEAVKNYLESQNSISDDEARRTDAVNKAVAELDAGGLTVGSAHEFGYGNTLAREVLKVQEGIDLDEYIVRDENGNIDYAATNEATENALFAINAENAIRAAQAETRVYIDDTRGRIDADIMGRMGVNGQATWKELNKSVDPRNINEYLTTARAASFFYSAGRNTDMSMDSAIDQFSGGAFRNIDKTVLKRAFAAGSRDRIIANTPGYGQTVEAGSNIALKKTEPIITGQLIMDDDIKETVPDTVQQAYIALAMSTNSNIYLKGDLSPVDKEGNPIINQATGLPVQLNGMSKGNDIYINVNASAEQNLGYVFMHEMTHQIKQYAPNEYLALENLVRDRWFNKDHAQMQQMIQSRIDLYRTKGGQSLTEEEAMEEIIADAMAEAMDDPNFAAQVCEEDINLGQQILNSIRAALRSIRQIFANGDFQNENFHNGLLSYLGILDEAEKMWITALHQARQNKADGLIADWQDRANKQSQERLSISESVEQNIMDWYDSTTVEQRRKEGGFIPIGTTPDVYKPLGIKETRLRIGKSKIQKILDDHPEMDIHKIVDTIKGLETPMIVLQSRTQKNSIVVYGEVYTDDGKPIMASVKFNRVSADIEDLKYGVVTSAYARNDNQYQLDNARVLYVNPDKEKTDSWLSSLRLQLPSDITNFGYISKLTYYEDLVKPDANSETAMARAIREAKDRKAKEAKESFSISEPVTHSINDDIKDMSLDEAAAYVNEQAKPLQNELDDVLQAISDDMGLTFERFKPKSIESIVDKVTRKNKEGIEYSILRMKDHARNKVLLKDHSVEQIKGFLDRLSSIVGDVNAELIGPTPFGYKGIHITGRAMNGLGYEIQLSTSEHWPFKLTGDTIYDKWRDYNSDIPQELLKEYEKDIERSNKMWDQFDHSEMFNSFNSLSDNTREFIWSSSETASDSGFHSPFANSENLASLNLTILPSSNTLTIGDTSLSTDSISQNDIYGEDSGGVQARFSVSEPVERVKDLIAVHNLKPQDIINTFELGGFPMPSIAVTKDSMGHDMYGDITLMFHSDTIDPEFFRANQVFGGDAFTPTFPSPSYKHSEKVADKIRDLYYENANRIGYDAMRGLYELGVTPDYAINRYGGEAGLKEHYSDDINLMRTYLRMNDADVEDVVNRTETTLSDAAQSLRQHFIDSFGEDRIYDFNGKDKAYGTELGRYRKQWVQENLDEIKQVYKDYFTKGTFKFSEEEVNNVLDNMKLIDYLKLMRNALIFLEDGATTVKEEVDILATNEAVKNAAKEAGYNQWLDDLLTGIEEKRGLRNKRDEFNARGNRRSWEQLHDPITLEGVVRNMSEELAAGGSTIFGSNPRAAANKQYKSLDEIREDENRLQQLPEDEYKAIEDAATSKLTKVCSEIAESNPDRFEFKFGATLDVGTYIAEILNETREKDTMQRKLKKDYLLDVTDEQMGDLMEAIDEIANLPTGYFEAKPRRAVGFDEVKAAIIPQNMDEDIKAGLENRGIPFYEYDPEVDGDRTKVVNQAATEKNLRFSISEDSHVMYTPKGVEVVQNPTDSEYRNMREEILSAYPWLRGTGEPLLRKTYDESGNEYYWNAFEAMHSQVEPYINKEYHTRTSQQWKWYEKPDKDDYPIDYSKQGYRFSITDSEGKALSEGQATFFADSKMVDTEGKLKPMYHGSQNEFYEFDITKAYPGTLGRGFYFSDSDSHAGVYGETNKYYLNLVHPLMSGTNTITKDQLYRFVSELAEDEDYGLDNYGYGATVDSVVDSVWGASDFAMLRDLNLTAVGDFAEALKVFNRVNNTDYDGIITDTETLAFYPQQIKSIDNLNPTLNKDTRYSITDSDGNELSDGQVDYFKNSQARDEQGRLVPVYHTTNYGGFTIFDPQYSDDKRSLFFASNWNVSQTYGRVASNPIDLNRGDRDVTLDEFVSMDGQRNVASLVSSRIIDLRDKNTGQLFAGSANGDYLKAGELLKEWYDSKGESNPDLRVVVPYQPNGSEDMLDYNGFVSWMNDMVADQDLKPRGYYSTYLNLENPLIVDAKGANWNNISYSESESNSEYDNVIKQAEDESFMKVSAVITEYGDYNDDGAPGKLTLTVKGFLKNEQGEWIPYNQQEEWKANPEDFDDPYDTYGELAENFNTYLWDELNFPDFFIEEIINTANKDGNISYMPGNDNPLGLEAYLTNDGGAISTKWDWQEYFEDRDLDIEVPITYKTRDLAKLAASQNHDGVIIRNCRDLGGVSPLRGDPISDIYIAFSSNQIKDTRNENPTENPDIRYSIADDESTMNYAQANAKSTDDLWATDPVIAEGRIRYSISKRDFINGVTNKWNPAWKTNGEILHEPSVEKDIRDVIMGAMRGSDTNAKYRQEMVKRTMLVARKAYNLMKKGKPSQAANLLYDHAHDIIDNLEFFGTDSQSEFERYKELRDYLKHTKITVPYDRRSDIDYAAYRKRNFGKILLGNDGIAPDKAWGELNEMWPEVFTEDIKGDIPGIMLQIENALDICQPMAQAYTSEQCEEFAGDIADALYDILYEGKDYKSLADRFDDKAKAMKARHEEAMLRMKDKLSQKDAKYDELKKRYQYDTAYLKAEKQRAIREIKEQNKQKEAEKKYNRVHRDLYNSVLKEYKDLTSKLLNPSKDRLKNIPEQLRQPLAEMLVCFDLEKERSKELEAQYMIPTKSQLNFRQLKDAMEKVAAENKETEFDLYFNYIKDKMTDIADRVDGKTIDYLDNEDIRIIKDMLIGLNAAIKNWQQLEIDGQNYQAQQVCDKVGEGAIEHQKLYGKAKAYSGPRAIIDNIVNMGELTPIYFFRQLKGMYDMYRQIRKGFDDYVINEREIINKIAKILEPFYKQNRKGQRIQGSEIEDWRHLESAETFTLINGETITLTIAQRMSLYCLAKREQAKSHMLSDKGGIVASEITAGSKMHKAQELLKGKDVEYKEAHLTPADISNICATLTTDQMHIADQLQELMSKDMSELGNRTSKKLISIEMYKETDYFPIKVQGESLPKSLDNIGMREKVRNPGFSNPLKENASNPIIIDDIFAVTAKHCNEMNMYSSYAVPLTNFMKVYNGSVLDENGNPTKIQTVIKETYGDKAIQYIDNFLDDINGNSFKRHGGLDDVLDKALGQAKKAAVFANLRVALQQPTAIVRAFAVMHPKYFKGVKPSAKESREMFEHCPIAQWKAWGYYDTHFGRDIEDVMMGANTPSRADYLMSEIYGQFDNITWGMIWQAVKNEVRAQNKGIDETSQEFWDKCNERASFVFDSTQVVDSPFHRSNDMRSKNGLVKQLTSFQSEPTLSFNVLRQGFVDAIEAAKKGDKKTARRFLERVLAVWVAQATTVALAQSLVDALRRKGADDDDDPKFLELWWSNFITDFIDDLNPINNVYYFKEIVPPILNAATGQYVFGQQNLTFQWVTTLTNGIQQVRKKWEKGEGYSKSWYDCLTELFGGMGYLAGVPIKTMMRGAKNFAYWFNRITGIEVFADDGSVDKAVDNFVDKFRREKSDNVVSKTTSDKKSKSEQKAAKEDNDAKAQEYREGLSDKLSDEQKDKLVKQYKKKLDAESEPTISEDFDVKEHVREGVANFEYEMERRSLKAAENAAGLTGNAKNNALWDTIAEGYTGAVETGNTGTIWAMREAFVENGGDAEWFDAKITDKMKSAYKKTITSEVTPGMSARQETMHNYLTEHGVSDNEISEIVRNSSTAKDLKAAMRIGKEEYIIDELTPLIQAGLTYEDFEYLYKYRNYGAKQYKGKYTGPEYRQSTGTFIWPTDGVITSHFGYRNAPTAGASSNHPAIDIGAPMGTPVAAADGGVVIYAGTNGGYGNSVGIKHDNGMVTYYNHLSAWNVKVGDQVAQGQQIANVGSTGISTGPHLDFKILDENGNPVDPEKYLN